jgi:hypothetical protein
MRDNVGFNLDTLESSKTMNVHSFIGMVVDAKRPEEDVEDGGLGGAESPRYEARMLRWSREFTITGADAGTPHGRQQKGWSWTRTRTQARLQNLGAPVRLIKIGS